MEKNKFKCYVCKKDFIVETELPVTGESDVLVCSVCADLLIGLENLLPGSTDGE